MATINEWAILDYGETSNFLTTSAYVTNIQPAQKPILARLPNGNQVQSTNTGTLDLPNLPVVARLAHIIPGLASHSPISLVTLCKAGAMYCSPKLGVPSHIVATQLCAGANACAQDCG